MHFMLDALSELSKILILILNSAQALVSLDENICK